MELIGWNAAPDNNKGKEIAKNPQKQKDTELTLMFLINMKNDIPHVISMLIFDIVLLNIKRSCSYKWNLKFLFFVLQKITFTILFRIMH